MVDVGTDHGRLPAALVASGWVPRAVGIDDKLAPLEGARRHAARLGIDARSLSFRQGDGFAGVLPEDCATGVIAGMGGARIVRILDRGVPPDASLVLQPNIDEGVVRSWLGSHGWSIEAETSVLDRGRWFVVVAAGRSGAPQSTPTEADIAFGRASHQTNPEAFRHRLQAIAHSIEGAQQKHPHPDAAAALEAKLVAVVRALDGASASRTTGPLSVRDQAHSRALPPWHRAEAT